MISSFYVNKTTTEPLQLVIVQDVLHQEAPIAEGHNEGTSLLRTDDS
jgi:hypothetical protein